jgi:long-chain acyl-CoA synthetase
MPDFDQPLTLPAVFAEAARRFPTRTAYIECLPGTRRTITWGELHQQVLDTAAGFVALGLERGDRVAVCAENSIDWIIAYAAAVTGGGVGVLVYYDLKAPEIIEQVARPACRFLVASPGVLEKLPKGVPGVESVILVGNAEVGAEQSGSPATIPLDELKGRATTESRKTLNNRFPAADDLAVIIYTSGTTGGPKGVMLTHRNIVVNGRPALRALNITGNEVVLLVLPMHHSMPFFATLVLPGLVGACFVIENDLRRIRDRLQEYRPTLFFGVPTLFDIVYRNLVARAEAEGRLQTLKRWQSRARFVKRLTGLNIGPLLFRPVHKALGGRLRFMVCGGAALNQDTAREFFTLGLPLLQGWGMSEASAAVAVQPFSRPRFLFSRHYEKQIGSVGRPIGETEVRLIDVPDKGIRVAVHGEGEMIIRGQTVFKGYWNAPDATKEATPDGWLHTGDLGRFDAAGNIYITGRSKYIIVLDSGEKVHPDELEDNLKQSTLLEDVCVLGRVQRDKAQVAAIVYPSVEAAQERADQEKQKLDEACLRRLVQSDVDRLGRQLAAYKRIGHIELSDVPLPKTALRKVARGQLKDAYKFDFGKWLASASEAESSQPAETRP